MSPILVPIESSYTTSYWRLILTYLISCTVSEIQHSVCPQSLYLATPLAFKPPTVGFLETISVNFSANVDGWPRYQMAKKHCPKFQRSDRVKVLRFTRDRKDHSFRRRSSQPMSWLRTEKTIVNRTLQNQATKA